MSDINYEGFLRARITELRLKKNISEHKMSLELGKSGSYIRGITSGAAMPSVKELFNRSAITSLVRWTTRPLHERPISKITHFRRK